MKNLYEKAAEEMIKPVNAYLLCVSEDYKNRYKALREAEDKIRIKLKPHSLVETFDQLVKKVDEKLMHELMRTLFLTIFPNREKLLFSMNEKYMLRNGEILRLRNTIYANLFPYGDYILEYENMQKRMTGFYFGEASKYISEFLEYGYKNYC